MRFPIVESDEGRLICKREVQRAKALSPMFVTESGISTIVRDDAPEKANAPIVLSELGLTTFVECVILYNLNSLGNCERFRGCFTNVEVMSVL